MVVMVIATRVRDIALSQVLIGESFFLSEGRDLPPGTKTKSVTLKAIVVVVAGLGPLHASFSTLVPKSLKVYISLSPTRVLFFTFFPQKSGES